MIAQQLVRGILAQRHLDYLISDNAAVVRMAGAMERACGLAIDAMREREGDDPALRSVLDQMHSELVAVLQPDAPTFENGWGNVGE